MVLPIRDNKGKVLAVLQLFNKNEDGKPKDFDTNDVMLGNLVSTQLQSNGSAFVPIESSYSELQVMTLVEGGLINKRFSNIEGQSNKFQF